MLVLTLLFSGLAELKGGAFSHIDWLVDFPGWWPKAGKDLAAAILFTLSIILADDEAVERWVRDRRVWSGDGPSLDSGGFMKLFAEHTEHPDLQVVAVAEPDALETRLG